MPTTPWSCPVAGKHLSIFSEDPCRCLPLVCWTQLPSLWTDLPHLSSEWRICHSHFLGHFLFMNSLFLVMTPPVAILFWLTHSLLIHSLPHTCLRDSVLSVITYFQWQASLLMLTLHALLCLVLPTCVLVFDHMEIKSTLLTLPLTDLPIAGFLCPESIPRWRLCSVLSRPR